MKENSLVQDLITVSQKTKRTFSPIVQLSGEFTRHEQAYSMDITNVSSEDESSTYIPNILKKLTMAKGAKGILYLDISNFYASIYTHTFPTIKLGYNETQRQFVAFKANQQDSSITQDYLLYKNLDIFVRNMNRGRTNGILPGTLISQFIAEALLSNIDNEIENRNIKFIRYVDDYEVFIYDEQQIELIQNEISSILERYGLVLNNEKTKYNSFPYYVINNLEKIYRQYTIKKVSKSELMELFNEFFVLEKSGVKGATRFLVKSIDNRLDVNNLIPIYESYLLDILVNDSRSLVKICELIIKQKAKLNFAADDMQIIYELLKKHIQNKNHLEAIWLLYLIRKINVNALPDFLCDLIFLSDNDLLKIMYIEEYEFSDEKKQKLCIDNAKSWILLYHLFSRNFIDKKEFESKSKIKHNLGFYALLKRSGFKFYKTDTKTSVVTVPDNE